MWPTLSSSLKYDPPPDLADELETIAPPTVGFYDSTGNNDDELILNLEERHVSFDKDEEMLLNQLKEEYEQDDNLAAVAEEEETAVKSDEFAAPPAFTDDLKRGLESSIFDEVKMLQDDLTIDFRSITKTRGDSEEDLPVKKSLEPEEEPEEEEIISPPPKERVKIKEEPEIIESAYIEDEEEIELSPVQSPTTKQSEEMDDFHTEKTLEKEVDLMKDEESDQEIESLIKLIDKPADVKALEDIVEQVDEPKISISPDSPAALSPVREENKSQPFFSQSPIRQISPPPIVQVLEEKSPPRIVDSVPKYEERFEDIYKHKETVKTPEKEKPIPEKIIEIIKPIEKMPDKIKEIPPFKAVSPEFFKPIFPVEEKKEPIKVEEIKPLPKSEPPEQKKEEKVELISESKITSPKSGKTDDSKKTYVPAYSSYMITKPPYSSGVLTQPQTTMAEPYNVVMRNQMLVQDEKRQRTSNSSVKSSQLREQFLFNSSTQSTQQSQPIPYPNNSQTVSQTETMVASQRQQTGQQQTRQESSRTQQEQSSRRQGGPSAPKSSGPYNDQQNQPSNLPVAQQEKESKTEVAASPADNKAEKRDLPDISSTVVKLTNDEEDYFPCAQVIHA